MRGYCCRMMMAALLAAGGVAAQPQAGAQPAGRTMLGQLSQAMEELTWRVAPSVVQIVASGYGLAGPEGESTAIALLQRARGSGVILDSEGYIVTNAHVVAGAQNVQVVLATRIAYAGKTRSILKPATKPIPAQVLGLDFETDLAVLKVDFPALPALELGDSDDLAQGEMVLAFGSPLGLENSVSLGVVSSTARQLRPEDPMIYIQTDASINPGNSGGPLVDTEGRVVGINTMILSQSGGSEGLGFAAPSNIVRNVYQQIRKTGRVSRGHIGVETQTITPRLAEGLHLSRFWGVLVSDVEPGGPSDRAGLRLGDVIVALDGRAMENARQFQVNLYSRPRGATVHLELLRGQDTIGISVAVAERPADPESFTGLVTGDNLVARLGILGLDLDRRVLDLLPSLRKGQGVLVAALTPSASFLQDALRPGDIVHEINGDPIPNLEGLRTALSKLKAGDPTVLQIERRRRLMYLPVELP